MIEYLTYMIKSAPNTSYERLLSNAPVLDDPNSYFVGTRVVDPLLPRNVIVTTRSKNRLPSTRHPNKHHRFLLMISLSGDGEAIVDSVRHVLPAGCCILIFPWQLHYFYLSTRDIFWILISFELPDSTSLEKNRGKTLKATIAFWDVLELLTKHHKPGSDEIVDSERSVLMTAALLAELNVMQFVNTVTASSMSNNNSGKAFADKVNRLIVRDLSRNWSVEELSEEFRMSSSHFRAKYRKAMKVGVGTYMRQLKLHNAMSLLGGTDLNVGEIAERCGYESLYSFSRAFKNETGKSPLAFKKSC